MKDLHALRARLRQAGLKPASELKPPAPKPAALPADWPGRAVPTPIGKYYLAEYQYGEDFFQGKLPLLDFLNLSPLPDFLEVTKETDPARMVFMDTETTGLAGGTGTLAFLVGVGTCAEGTFRLRQYFLPDPAGEAGMLEAVLAEMEEGSALVTFNGRGFDVPILQARSALRLRRYDALTDVPHLDLLPHARRLWKRRLESCALRSLEADLLDVRRSTEDVPSSMIPYLYREYLRTGDPNLISGVLYHNAQDILSMAVLLAEVLGRYTRPPSEIEYPADVLSLAFVYRGLGRIEPAEAAFRAAIASELGAVDRIAAWEGLAALLKTRGSSAAAVEFWEAWYAFAPDDPRPSIELAKFHEWRTRDLPAALLWAGRALSAADGLPDSTKRRMNKNAVDHRIKRLRRKTA
jgi:uncharacterized protein YprB with RNaseH-like and TPR domain